jgi:hypothetical protein
MNLERLNLKYLLKRKKLCQKILRLALYTHYVSSDELGYRCSKLIKVIEEYNETHFYLSLYSNDGILHIVDNGDMDLNGVNPVHNQFEIYKIFLDNKILIDK